MSKELDSIYKEIAEELGIDKDVVGTAVKGMFAYVLKTWRNFDPNVPITKEDFVEKTLTFKFGSIGCFYPKYSRIIRYKKRTDEGNKENEGKEDNPDVY